MIYSDREPVRRRRTQYYHAEEPPEDEPPEDELPEERRIAMKNMKKNVQKGDRRRTNEEGRSTAMKKNTILR